MSRRSRPPVGNLFLSFLDLCSCALGGLILLKILLIPRPSDDQKNQEDAFPRRLEVVLRLPSFGDGVAIPIELPEAAPNSEYNHTYPLTVASIKPDVFYKDLNSPIISGLAVDGPFRTNVGELTIVG